MQISFVITSEKWKEFSILKGLQFPMQISLCGQVKFETSHGVKIPSKFLANIQVAFAHAMKQASKNN